MTHSSRFANPLASFMGCFLLWHGLASPAQAQDRYHPEFATAVREMKARNWMPASTIYARILKDKPEHHEARNNYAVCLIKLRRFGEAEQQLDYVLSKAPDKPGARLNLGVTKVGKNDLSAGLTETTTALSLREKEKASNYHLAEAHYNLGWIRDEQGNQSEAIDSLREAVKLRPDYGKAWLMLAIALAELRRYPEARKAMVEASRFQHTDPDLPPLIKSNSEVLDTAEKTAPPLPEQPPPTQPVTPAPSTPESPPTRTFLSDGFLGKSGLWDVSKVAAIGVYLVGAIILVIGCHRGFRAYYRPPLSQNERSMATGWTVVFSIVLFGLGWGWVGCVKWAILLVAAVLSGLIVNKANE